MWWSPSQRLLTTVDDIRLQTGHLHNLFGFFSAPRIRFATLLPSTQNRSFRRDGGGGTSSLVSFLESFRELNG
jgi:hypothetical protein